MVRFLVLMCVAMLTALASPRPAAADDTLSVIGGANANAFFEVLTNVAERAGFYKEEHLIVSTQYAGSPNIAAQLVASGKADLCGQAVEPIIQGYEKGIHLVTFFARDPHYEFVLAVLDASPIKTLADFKGATIGELSIGSPGEISADSTLSGAGLRKGDYSYIPIGTASQGLQAIAGKKVDGAEFPYVELALYEVESPAKFRYFWDPILKDVGDTAYAASPATIAAKGDQLRRFSRANVMAAILIRENPRLAARYFLEGAGMKVTDESLSDETRLLELTQSQLPGYDPASKRIGYISPVGIEILAKYLYGAGLTKQIVPASAVVTNEFIDYANDFDHGAFIAQVKRMH
jgi:NitT/TauT family transport system substrate-binding protein